MSRRGVGWWAVATLVALAVGGPDPAGQAPESGFSLRPCQSGAEGGRGECGRLTVFENRAARRGRRIDIHFMVLRAEKPGARLGYEKVSLYGGSYGSRMAQAYLRRHPERISAVVLDGVVPFDVAVPLTYARSAQQALDRVFAACAARPACQAAHPDPGGDMSAIQRRLAAERVTAKVTPRSGLPVRVPLSAGDFGYAVRGILYSARTAPELPDLLGRAIATGSLDEFAQRYYDREARFADGFAHGLHFSVFCAEDVPFPTEQDIVDATEGTFLGCYLFDEYRHACANWPRGAIRADARTPVTARVPTLLISGWFDPSTPTQFAERVAQTLSEHRLLVAPSGAHVSAFSCAGPAAGHVLATGSFAGMPAVCGQ